MQEVFWAMGRKALGLQACEWYSLCQYLELTSIESLTVSVGHLDAIWDILHGATLGTTVIKHRTYVGLFGAQSGKGQL